MVEDDVAIQNLLICCTLKLFEDHGIKMDYAELLSLLKYSLCATINTNITTTKILLNDNYN